MNQVRWKKSRKKCVETCSFKRPSINTTINTSAAPRAGVFIEKWLHRDDTSVRPKTAVQTCDQQINTSIGFGFSKIYDKWVDRSACSVKNFAKLRSFLCVYDSHTKRWMEILVNRRFPNNTDWMIVRGFEIRIWAITRRFRYVVVISSTSVVSSLECIYI